LPSKEVITATTITQLIATVFAATGFLMPSQISLPAILGIWMWAFLWMQISELTKSIIKR
jgi:hypothetical protein